MGGVLFWIILGQGLLLIVLGAIYATYPPKKINYIYGYRTRRSMANQQVWDYSNKIGARMIIQVGLLTTAIGLIVLWLYPGSTAIIIQAGVMVAGLIFGMYICEKDLDKHFDKQGNPKSKG